MHGRRVVLTIVDLLGDVEALEAHDLRGVHVCLLVADLAIDAALDEMLVWRSRVLTVADGSARIETPPSMVFLGNCTEKRRKVSEADCLRMSGELDMPYAELPSGGDLTAIHDCVIETIAELLPPFSTVGAAPAHAPRV
eukprot:PLAT14768.2.p1 GENE.PLAT14768.2~~PLAT14768.2.p1  ORF type:complete len:139 (+),score=63.20 PLAT14768.2:247-663(+)